MSQLPFPQDAGASPASVERPSFTAGPPPIEPVPPQDAALDAPVEAPMIDASLGATGATGATPARLMGRGPRPGKRLISPQEAAASNRKLTAEQKLLILDTWQRSGLPAHDFGALVGISRLTLYAWKKKFQELGPAGLMEQPRKGAGVSKIPDLTKRTILMLKKAKPFSVHAEGERVFMLGQDGQRTEIDLATAHQIAGAAPTDALPGAPGANADLPEPVTAHGLVNADLQHEAEPPPGVSPLDAGLHQMDQSISGNIAGSPVPEGGDL